MKNASILREYVRSVISEGVLEPIEGDSQEATISKDTQKIADIFGEVAGWLNSKSDEIKVAADDFGNPFPKEEETIVALLKSALVHDRSKNYKHPYTVAALCVQIAGSEDVALTNLATLVIDTLPTVLGKLAGGVSSFVKGFFKENYALEEAAFALPAGLATMGAAGWAAVALAVYAAVATLWDASWPIELKDISGDADVEYAKGRAEMKIRKVADRIKDTNEAVASGLRLIADGATTSSVSF